VQPQRYIDTRIVPSIAFYRHRIPLYARRRYALRLVLLSCAMAATLFSRYQYELWVVVVSSGAAAITSWSEYSDTGRKTERYTRAVFALTNLLSWWSSLSDVEKASTSTISHLILKAEGIISEERLAWLSLSTEKEKETGKDAIKEGGGDDAGRGAYGGGGKGDLAQRGMGALQNQGFDQEAFQILGVPGIEITPETQLQDGTIIPGMLNDKGQVTQGPGEEEEDDCSLELSWDPESEFGTASNDDLIAKNMAMRIQKQEDEEFERKAEEKKKLRAELEEHRAARTLPTGDPAKILEYLLQTEINELEFEMTRCRPELTPEFFENVEAEVLAAVEGERKEQLQAMLKATNEFVVFMDANVKALATPQEKLKALLEAPNKREKIADMGANGEIDDPFMALFFANIDGAYSSGNMQAGDFMTKVYDACKKFQKI